MKAPSWFQLLRRNLALLKILNRVRITFTIDALILMVHLDKNIPENILRNCEHYIVDKEVIEEFMKALKVD